MATKDRKKYELVCDVCGKKFHSNYSRYSVCSVECAKAYSKYVREHNLSSIEGNNADTAVVLRRLEELEAKVNNRRTSSNQKHKLRARIIKIQQLLISLNVQRDYIREYKK